MSNLSELLPAGAGAKSAAFVASGTLGSGVTVVLKADGTVTAVSSEGTPSEAGSSQVFDSTAAANWTSIAYDPNNNKVVVIYGVGSFSTAEPRAVVGTISGTSISFGTPVPFDTSVDLWTTTIAYDSAQNKFLIAYSDYANNLYGYVIVGTVSGNSISFGTRVAWQSNQVRETQAVYNPVTSLTTVAFSLNNTSGRVSQFIISGTTASSPALDSFESGRVTWVSVTYDSTNNKIIIFYSDNNNSNRGTVVVGTPSGNSLTFGTPYVLSGQVSYTNCAFDPDTSKVIIVYNDDASPNGKAAVGTVSGTSISFGTPVVYNSGTTWISGVDYDSYAKKIVVAYRDNSDGNKGKVLDGVVSGTTISFGASTTFKNNQVEWLRTAYDPSSQATAIIYGDANNSYYGTSNVYKARSSNVGDFIGITDQAIADTATGAVIVQGGVSGKAKGPITTAVGARSTFNSGSTTYPDMVYDEANQKIILSYRDDGNSGYSTAVVGTVSGTSISWGTPVIIRSSTSVSGIGPKIAYDSATEQVVIAYLISDIGYAKVGKVSGASISFGAEATFEAGNTANNSIAYDTANAKVVIAYRYNTAPATDDGYAVVGTVSGTSISFGSRVLFDSGTALYTSTVYDSNTGKIVISYDSNGPKAIVGTVSGTSISFGSITTITMTLPNMTYSDLVYDAGSQKAVLFTRKSASPNNGLALVGTVSGTSISFGTEVEFTTDAINFMAATYDSTLGKVAICYEEAATDDGKMVLGTVSGTSISFTDPVIFDSTSTVNYVTAATYDPNEQVVVAGYSDSASSNFGRATAISVTTPLTIGSDYYVQADGSLSTTVSSVPAGRALSSTSILLEG